MTLLRELNETEAEVIKQFLLTTPLTQAIDLYFEPIDLTVQITGLNEPYDDPSWDGMKTSTFLGPDNNYDNPMLLGGRPADLEICIGRWSDAAKLDASHIVLSSFHPRLDQRFGQIELSTCLSDGHTAYLTKNITRHGGDGAIKRLNAGASDSHDRAARRERLVEALGAQVLEHEGTEHLVVSAVPLREARRGSGPLLARVLTDLLIYAGQVECIRATGECAPLAGGQVGGRYRHRLSAEERSLLESAARAEARRWLEEKAYRVRDVSDRKVGYDLHAQRETGRLLVEVKGTTMPRWSVELTASEYECAVSAGDEYLLLVVVLDDVSRRCVQAVLPFYNPVANPACAIAPSRFTVAPSGGRVHE